MMDALAHVDTWIFDLDNTLYPAKADLFALMDVKMGEFIQGLLGCDADVARETQKRYFLEHGTTLSGLMHHHGIEPGDYLAYVHDISMDRLEVDEALNGHIAALPGRRLIFTNGDADYAGRVLDRLGLGQAFELIHDIHACQYVPKPDPSGYDALCRAHDVDPTRAAFFEDMARNLAPAHEMGMTCVWIASHNDWAKASHDGDHVHHVVNDLTQWLEIVAGP